MKQRILQVFLNTNLGNGEEGLKRIVRKYAVSTTSLAAMEPGEYLVFINRRQDKVKILVATDNVKNAMRPFLVAYIRLPVGQRVSLTTIKYFPQAFTAGKHIDYDKALKLAVHVALLKRQNTSAPIETFH